MVGGGGGLITNFQKASAKFLNLSPNLKFRLGGGGGGQFTTLDAVSKFAKI